jgi:hypothetical protein
LSKGDGLRHSDKLTTGAARRFDRSSRVDAECADECFGGDERGAAQDRFVKGAHGLLVRSGTNLRRVLLR